MAFYRGLRNHEEYWIPFEKLNEFNEHITGTIEIVSVYFGKDFDPQNFTNTPELKKF